MNSPRKTTTLKRKTKALGFIRTEMILFTGARLIIRSSTLSSTFSRPQVLLGHFFTSLPIHWSETDLKREVPIPIPEMFQCLRLLNLDVFFFLQWIQRSTVSPIGHWCGIQMTHGCMWWATVVQVKASMGANVFANVRSHHGGRDREIKVWVHHWREGSYW